MKEKIKAALATKYKNLGLSDKVLEGVAAFLEATTTADDQIDAAVASVEGMLKGVQSEVDTRVTTAVAKAKTPPADPAKPEGGNPPTIPPTVPDDVPAYMKQFMEGMQAQMQTLTGEISSIKSGDTAKSRKTQLTETLKDAPAAYRTTIEKAFARMNFEKDEDFTAYLEEVKTDSAAFVQEEANTGLSKTQRPITPGGPTSKVASKEEVQAIFGKPKS